MTGEYEGPIFSSGTRELPVCGPGVPTPRYTFGPADFTSSSNRTRAWENRISAPP